MSHRSSLLVIVAAVTGFAAVWWLGPAARAHRTPAPTAPQATPAVPEKAEAGNVPTKSRATRTKTNEPMIVAGDAPEQSPLLPRYGVPSKAEGFQRAESWNETPVLAVVAADEGEVVGLPLLDGRVLKGRVNSVHVAADGQRIIAGELTEEAKGTFAFGLSADGVLGGQVFPAAGRSVYVVETGRDGRPWLLERWKDSVVCMEFPKPPAVPAATETVTTAAAAMAPGDEFLLSSRPTATAVAYLDFDGETVTDSLWNSGFPISAAASGLSPAQIVEAWRRVAEDYRPFNVDITTNRARYDAAPVKSRMRCIITPTSDWYGAAGGVAYISSWRQSGSGSFSSTIPCWVFSNMLAMSGRYVGEAISHEIGHTLGLSHDGVPGQTYYTGHGAGGTGWAPIMGVGYYQNLVQWSKGEYPNANNLEDDLAIITASSNNVPYIGDEAGATPTEAAVLRSAANGSVDTVGTIASTGEVDMYAFTTAGGVVSFQFAPEVTGDEGVSLPNLDARATLYNAAGQVVASAAPDLSLAADLTATVAPGTYYLAIDGTGVGTLPLGYSNYGSIGRYEIVGTVPPAAAAAPILFGVSSVTVASGAATTYAIEATGLPTSYSASGLPTGLSLNAATGVISGTPTMAGIFPVNVAATNALGTGTRVVTFSVTSALGTIVDCPTLPLTTGGGTNWYEDWSFYHDGMTGLRSGTVGANGISWAEAPLTGAGTLSFWWRVSSEANADYLRLSVDGVEVAKISGTVNWTLFTYAVPAGTHTVRWSYTKNNKTNSGSDAGWIDGVSYVKAAVAPIITSSSAVRCLIGQAFSYQIAASNSPTSYGATGLPAGLALDPATGVISGVPANVASRGFVATTISATNSGGTGSAGLTIDVESPFSAWLQDAAVAGAAAAANADPDCDGVGNFLEYAFARSAIAAESTTAKLPFVSTVDDGSGPSLAVVFTVPDGRPELRYTVQVSSDLVTWESGQSYGLGATAGADLPTEEVSRSAVDGGQEFVVRDRNVAGAARRFLRVVVTAE